MPPPQAIRQLAPPQSGAPVARVVAFPRVADQRTFRWTVQNPRFEAVSGEAGRTIEHGYELARKGAFYSARAEFRAALQMVAEALDAENAVVTHTQALTEALEALDEARDFVGTRARGRGTSSVPRIAAAHRTSLLHDAGDDVPALIAAQRYFAFAHQRFEAALGGAPAGSAALHALGKVQQRLGERQSETELDAALAATFHKAALAVDPGNFEAANELGVLLARVGQLQGARDALRQSVATRPSAEAWHNLAVVHSRLGEAELAALAEYERQRTGVPSGTLPANGHMVQWVAPQAFAGPPPSADGAVAIGAGGAYGRPVGSGGEPAAAQPAARAASSPSTGFTWPW